MPALLATVLALLASLTLYLAAATLIQRPMTVGELAPLIARKVAYTQSLPGRRLLVLAGSNGRYSHRCEALTQVTGWPCSNLSLAVGVGLDFQLMQFEPLMRTGDVLYLPLEYSQYAVERDEMEAGAENTLLLHHFPTLLWSLPLQRVARVYGSLEPSFLIHGVMEMVLQRLGTQRRSGLDSLTPQGDEFGHTAAASQAYRAFLASAAPAFDKPSLPAQSHALAVVEAFLARARVLEIQVVGGLPTAPIGIALDAASLMRLQSIFARHGHTFLVLPSKSNYALDCFHDTLYHLNQECQVAHSQAVGQAMAPLLQQGL